jgi:hypothetical protein
VTDDVLITVEKYAQLFMILQVQIRYVNEVTMQFLSEIDLNDIIMAFIDVSDVSCNAPEKFSLSSCTSWRCM